MEIKKYLKPPARFSLCFTVAFHFRPTAPGSISWGSSGRVGRSGCGARGIARHGAATSVGSRLGSLGENFNYEVGRFLRET